MGNLTLQPPARLLWIGRLFILLGLVDFLISARIVHPPASITVYFPYIRYLLYLKYPTGIVFWGLIYIACGYFLIFGLPQELRLITVPLETGVSVSFLRFCFSGSPASFYAFAGQAVFTGIILWQLYHPELKAYFAKLEEMGKPALSDKTKEKLAKLDAWLSSKLKLRIKPKEKKQKPDTLASRFKHFFYFVITGLVMVLGFKLYHSLAFHEPLLLPPPARLALPAQPVLTDNRKVEIFNTVLSLPQGFYLARLAQSGDNGWTMVLACKKYPAPPGAIQVMFINLPSFGENLYQNLSHGKEFFNDFTGYNNAFDFEKAYSNGNLGIGPQIVRATRDKPLPSLKTEYYGTANVKGFLRTIKPQKKIRLAYETSAYSPSGQQSQEMRWWVISGTLQKEQVMNILASLSWIEERNQVAYRYYQEGRKLLLDKDLTGAQFKLAQAYYLSPATPAYGYLLAKLIRYNCHASAECARDILDKLLQQNPQDKAALELRQAIAEDLKAWDKTR